MAAKLSNDELATRVRARTQRNSAKYRERLARSGRTQTLVWLPDTIRTQLDSLVEARNESLSAVTTELLTAALTPTPNQTTTTPDTATRASNDSTVDLFGDSKPVDLNPAPGAEPSPKLTQAERDERDRAIVELHRQGLKNPEIGRRFNTSEGSIRKALTRAKELDVTK